MRNQAIRKVTDLSFVKEITPGSIGIFSLLAVVTVALIKAWPVLALQAQTARAALRGEERADRNNYQTQIDDLREEVHKIEMRLVGTISAYRILDTEVETHLPDSVALVQARRVMSAAFTVAPSTDAPSDQAQIWHEIRTGGRP